MGREVYSSCMVKIRGMVVVLGVLVLSGCGAAGVSAPAESAAPVDVAASETPAPVLTAEPVAEPGAAQFEERLHNIEGLANADAAAAVPIAKTVCEQLDTGTAPADLTPVANATAAANFDFVYVAASTYCDSHAEAVSDATVAARQSGAFG